MCLKEEKDPQQIFVSLAGKQVVEQIYSSFILPQT